VASEEKKDEVKVVALAPATTQPVEPPGQVEEEEEEGGQELDIAALVLGVQQIVESSGIRAFAEGAVKLKTMEAERLNQQQTYEHQQKTRALDQNHERGMQADKLQQEERIRHATLAFRALVFLSLLATVLIAGALTAIKFGLLDLSNAILSIGSIVIFVQKLRAALEKPKASAPPATP